MTQDTAGWGLQSRKQFLGRGGAFLGALALGRLAHVPVAAAADAPTALTSEEISVLGALESAILIAAGQLKGGSAGSSGGGAGGNQGQGNGSGPVAPSPQAIADSGLQSPAAIAQGFAASDPESRAYIAGLLDAIDSAPSSGAITLQGAPPSATFTSLTDAERQAFIPTALAPLAPPPATAAELAGLRAFYEAAGAAAGLGALAPQAATQSGATPQGPPPPSSPASVMLAQTLLAGLQLVATPPPAPIPQAPPPVPLPPQAVASVVSLLEQVLVGIAPARPPQSLIDELTAGLPQVELPPPPLPVPVLGEAIAVWLSRA